MAEHPPPPPGSLSALERLSDELVALVARVVPAVVALFGSGRGSASSGSGFLIDDQGHLVTNYHVVQGMDPVFQTILHAGARGSATLLGSDPTTDLALLRLHESDGLPALVLREAPARLGEICIGLGSPFGMYPESVAIGVVSGVARTLDQEGYRPIDRAIQTDVAINPGNSGGPLVDVRGDVIGVNKSVDTRGQGIGFAIPADTTCWVIEQLKAEGTVVRAALGVTVVPKTVEVDGGPRVGLEVIRVGPAGSQNGLAEGDVLLAVEGQAVDEAGDLHLILTKDLIDRPTDLEILRGGTVQHLTVHPSRLEG
jgi:S1-C subfamily serine protease